MNNKNKSVVYLDTTYFPTREEYFDFLLDTSLYTYEEAYEKSQSDKYYIWVREIHDMDYDDFLSNSEFCIGHENYKGFILQGSCGTWQGRRTIMPVFFDSIENAVAKIANGCDDLKISFTKGVLEILGMHHDGINSFSLMPISKKGEKHLKDYMQDGTCIDIFKDSDVKMFECKEYLY